MIRRFSTVRKCLTSAVNTYTSRTHTCGELGLSNEGERVSVVGWLVHKRMNKFLVLRDSYGTVQTTISNEPHLSDIIKELPYESVIRVDGVVADRGANKNVNMTTGEIEIKVENIQVLNRASHDLPLQPGSSSSEKTRLKYRYIDLRSQRMQKALRLRSEFVHSVRKFLVDKRKFVDVETPTLFRRTPGGAAEFVVPAPAPNHGSAYSLPQSPQQFKQLLMIGGIDRYFQIARCYRDEGAKGDRQPEFTQVDLEMSFTTKEGVMALVEDILHEAWPESLAHIKPPHRYPQMTYSDAMRLYGSDKPDLRFDWVIEDCTQLFEPLRPNHSFYIWEAKAIVCRDVADHQISNSIRAQWKRLLQANSKATNFAICFPTKPQWFKNIAQESIQQALNVGPNDIVLFSWGHHDDVNFTLGQLRNYVAEAVGIRAQKKVVAHWIVDFPLFEMENGRLCSTHHPFTAPVEEHVPKLYKDVNHLTHVTGQHYDLVINGVEMGGGSIRIHDSEMQNHVLRLLEEPTEDMKHLLDALSHGAPPHGGFALGLDRFVSLLAAEGDPTMPVREVIAFPKTKEGKDLMSSAPAVITVDQMNRYGFNVAEQEKANEKLISMLT